MAEAPFSDEDSGPSIKLFSPSPSTIPEIEGAACFKCPNPDEESLVPFEELSSEPGSSEKNCCEAGDSRGSSDDIEQQISESLDQLSTSPNETSTPKASTSHSDCGSDSEEPRRQARVGNHYQARIPRYFGPFNNQSTSSEMSDDELLWDPCHTNSETVEVFLRRLSSLTKMIIPTGTHVRDDEQALFILQQSDYDVDKALEALKTELSSIAQDLVAWTEEECKNFETGLLNFGKNFFLIQKNKLTTRQTGELVQFYYLWKKSERYDLFASRIRAGKKKYALNPGISDLMNKYVHGWKDNCSSVHSDVQFILADVNKKDSHQSDVQY